MPFVKVVAACSVLKSAAGPFAFAAFSVLFPATVIAQVVSDGTTATNVVVNGDGSVTVGIAPTKSNGVSLNRYDQFNVRKPGVQIDNRVQAARTIVNEVTGNSRTNIEGSLEVLGQRAHVIVANPNGIMIDGGRFVNTGRVALTTGKISTTSRQIAPDIYQQNVVSSVEGGTITVNGGGLSGQMDAIDLIAHSIRVNGTVTNLSTSKDASIRLAAGRATAEFDSSILPGNTALSWGNITGEDTEQGGKVLVEVTRPGVLRANQVTIEVNNKGAGVRFAGEGYATARSFVLSADGQIDLSGAKILAEEQVVVAGGGVKLDRSKLTASEGPLRLAATQAGGAGIIGRDFTLGGKDIFLISEAGLSFGVSKGGNTNLGSTVGDIIIQTKKGIEDFGSNITAQRNLVITTDQKLSFSESTLKAKTGSVHLDAKGAITATGTLASGFGHMLVTGDEVKLENGTRRTEIKAENGSFVLTTLGVDSAGNLTSTGGLIQGAVKTDGLEDSAKTQSTGAVTLNVKGSVINTTAKDLAIIFGAGGDIYIRTGADIENNRGRIVANGDVKLVAKGDVLNMVHRQGDAADPKVVQYTRKGRRQWWTLWIKRKRDSYVSYDYGTLKDTDRLAAITATGGVNIKTDGSLVNHGGNINANGGDLEIKAIRVETVGLGSGKVYVRKTCALSCSFEGEGSVVFYGGKINASDNIKIEATEKFHNKAGAVFAIDNVEIITANAELEAALVPTMVSRPKGLYNFWSSKSAWVFLRDQFGSVIADTGAITVKSGRSVKIKGGTLSAGRKVELENGKEIVRAPGAQSDAVNHTIGFFADLPLIRQ